MTIDKIKFLNVLKIIGIVFVCIVAFTLLVLPYIALYNYFNKKGQKIQIVPEFKIIKIENATEVNNDILTDALRLSKEIIKKLNGEK
jgi:hypothetical protein